jgi:hypothetical protein
MLRLSKDLHKEQGVRATESGGKYCVPAKLEKRCWEETNMLMVLVNYGSMVYRLCTIIKLWFSGTIVCTTIEVFLL